MRAPGPSPAASGARFAWGRWLLLALMTGAVAAAYAAYVGLIDLPERYNPWKPLDLTAAPGPLTSYKLSRALNDPARCRDALAQTGMQYDRLPDRVTGPGCGFENAVRLRSAPVRFGAPLTLSCPVALSFFMWERHALQPAAQQHFGRPLVAVDNLGSYACRNINRGEGTAPGKAIGNDTGSRSRHATANALDISGFTFEGGRHLSVQKDYPAGKPPQGPEQQWLADAHSGACTWFRGVLGPDYNAVHRDHFHLEAGGYNMCR